MKMISLPSIILVLSSVGLSDAFKGNFRMQVKTTKHCVDLRDQHGNKAPCDTSVAPQTFGLTLPGMEDGSISTLKDVIVANDGEVVVEAAPTLPYQYLMTSKAAGYSSREQLFKNEARFIGEEPAPRPQTARATPEQGLQDQGWELKSQNGQTKTFVKEGLEGVDPQTGQNFTDLYVSGVAPNMWTLITDMEETPQLLTATNTFFDDYIHQTSEFTQHEALPSSYSVGDAKADMYSTYAIQEGRRRLSETSQFPPVELSRSVEDIPEDLREFYESHVDLDWAAGPSTGLRKLGRRAGIPYFTIEEGSAAFKFFNAGPQRRLLEVVNFELPSKCSDDSVKNDHNYCLSLSVDTDLPNIALAVKASAAFKDVNHPELSAAFSLTLKLNLENGFDSLSFGAEGCAVVWMYGVGSLNLNINVCMYGGAEIKQDQGSGFVKVEVAFALKLPVVGELIKDKITAEVDVTVKPNNDISVNGKIGISRSVYIAGAGMGLDLKTNTVDNNPKKWYFDSGVFFEAWVDIWVWSDNWGTRFPIWHVTHEF